MTGNHRRGTRDRIIAIAASLIIERGADRTSMEDVRQAVGVTQAQLAEHFPDKTALFRGVLTRRPGVVPESPTHQALRNLDSLEALERWADLCVRQQQGNDFRGSCLLTTLAGQMATAGEGARADVGAGFGRWMAAISAGLRSMRDRGELRPDADPDDLASAVLATLQGGIVLAQARGDVGPLRSAVATMLTHVRSFAAPDTVPSAPGHRYSHCQL